MCIFVCAAIIGFYPQVLEAWATSIEHVASLTSKVCTATRCFTSQSTCIDLPLPPLQESLTPEERAFLLLFSATGLQLLTSTEERDSMSKTVQVSD